MLDQDEPTSQVDKGVLAFLGTISVWLMASLIVITVLMFVSNLDI